MINSRWQVCGSRNYSVKMLPPILADIFRKYLNEDGAFAIIDDNPIDIEAQYLWFWRFHRLCIERIFFRGYFQARSRYFSVVIHVPGHLSRGTSAGYKLGWSRVWFTTTSSCISRRAAFEMRKTQGKLKLDLSKERNLSLWRERERERERESGRRGDLEDELTASNLFSGEIGWNFVRKSILRLETRRLSIP